MPRSGRCTWTSRRSSQSPHFPRGCLLLIDISVCAVALLAWLLVEAAERRFALEIDSLLSYRDFDLLPPPSNATNQVNNATFARYLKEEAGYTVGM